MLHPDTLDLFNAMDQDGDGEISPTEMLEGLRLIGEEDVTEAEVEQVRKRHT
jgi:Ca2+-binding EF-hand superfamily protein